MDSHSLLALCPPDGRYYDKCSPLREFLSEYALIKNRLIIEIKWLMTLSASNDIKDLNPLSSDSINFLQALIDDFTVVDAERIKDIEKRTLHDVKAVEYYLREKLSNHTELKNTLEFIHFACTSEDINNLAYGLMLKNTKESVLLPQIDDLIVTLSKLSTDSYDVAMLARTHGQSASPTTFGKEMANVVIRLKRQRNILAKQEILGKLNGAVGNFNAHLIAYPNVNWNKLTRGFIENLELTPNLYTTQIEPHDYKAELFDTLARINTILLDFNRDMWHYISLSYLKLKKTENEIGSSTMPHKVNPIDFENAEGNLGIANALLKYLSSSLPQSRLQRDLSDSTKLRNIGPAIAHSTLGIASTLKGIKKITVNKDVMTDDLNQNWSILTEAVQTILRMHHVPDSYDLVKQLSHGKSLSKEDYHELVEKLPLSDHVKSQLKTLTPGTYTGCAALLAKEIESHPVE